MGTITKRARKDGSVGYSAQIRLKRGGIVVHSESETFDVRADAVRWLKRRETDLSKPGALEKKDDPTLAEVIAQYITESKRETGKTKAQVLAAIARAPLGALRCSQIGSPQIIEFARGLAVQPQTVGNYLAHLGSVISVARPAWGYPLDAQAMQDARVVADKLGLVSRSRQRSRRPTLAELAQLMEHFGRISARRCDAIPMQLLVLFAIFSTRRDAEITRLTWEDLDDTRAEIWVRDMKHPGEKIGNDVRVSLPPQAMAILRKVKPEKAAGRIWPHNPDSVSAAFTRACKVLAIEDLHLHDMRHEGISLLFEQGLTIPQVAQVSGHRTWASLKRYTHMRSDGDKFSRWGWFARLGLD